MKKKVLINSVEKIQDFVNITNEADCDIDLICGSRTYLDAKSLLGILSCNYQEPLSIDIHADEDESQELLASLDRFVVA